MSENSRTYTGSCLCGGVRYTATGPISDVVACHCVQCQKTSGFHVAATRMPAAQLQLEKSDSLKWFRSSERAERGFCAACGGNLFWREVGGESISVMAGTLDQPTGLKLVENIYTDFAGDYYDIPKLTG